MARLYKVHGWEAFATQDQLFGPDLLEEAQTSLETYFTPGLTRLLRSDVACQTKAQEMCRLDFDILFHSQDPRITDLEITRLSPGVVKVQFVDPVTNLTTQIEFRLSKVHSKWRISDVVYRTHEEQSLRLVLSRSLSITDAQLSRAPIPPAAKRVIRSVHAAAKTSDFRELRKWMTPDLTWSFGGDGDADQAVGAWQRDRKAMPELYRVTGLRCTFRGNLDTIQCPPNAGYHYRADFVNTPDGWRLAYFVAGD